MDSTWDDDELLLGRIAASDGARDALRRLYERHAAAVYAFVRRTCPGGVGAEDVLQETFLAAARAARGFSGTSAQGWLLGIAAHRIRDVLRSEGRRRGREERAARPESVEEEPADETLAAALTKLPATWRAALELRFDQERTHEETARILGVSVRTAKDWSKRGLARLKELLEHGASAPTEVPRARR